MDPAASLSAASTVPHVDAVMGSQSAVTLSQVSLASASQGSSCFGLPTDRAGADPAAPATAPISEPEPSSVAGPKAAKSSASSRRKSVRGLAIPPVSTLLGETAVHSAGSGDAQFPVVVAAPDPSMAAAAPTSAGSASFPVPPAASTAAASSAIPVTKPPRAASGSSSGGSRRKVSVGGKRKDVDTAGVSIPAQATASASPSHPPVAWDHAGDDAFDGSMSMGMDIADLDSHSTGMDDRASAIGTLPASSAATDEAPPSVTVIHGDDGQMDLGCDTDLGDSNTAVRWNKKDSDEAVDGIAVTSDVIARGGKRMGTGAEPAHPIAAASSSSFADASSSSAAAAPSSAPAAAAAPAPSHSGFARRRTSGVGTATSTAVPPSVDHIEAAPSSAPAALVNPAPPARSPSPPMALEATGAPAASSSTPGTTAAGLRRSTRRRSSIGSSIQPPSTAFLAQLAGESEPKAASSAVMEMATVPQGSPPPSSFSSSGDLSLGDLNTAFAPASTSGAASSSTIALMLTVADVSTSSAMLARPAKRGRRRQSIGAGEALKSSKTKKGASVGASSMDAEEDGVAAAGSAESDSVPIVGSPSTTARKAELETMDDNCAAAGSKTAFAGYTVAAAASSSAAAVGTSIGDSASMSPLSRALAMANAALLAPSTSSTAATQSSTADATTAATAAASGGKGKKRGRASIGSSSTNGAGLVIESASAAGASTGDVADVAADVPAVGRQAVRFSSIISHSAPAPSFTANSPSPLANTIPSSSAAFGTVASSSSSVSASGASSFPLACITAPSYGASSEHPNDGLGGDDIDMAFLSQEPHVALDFVTPRAGTTQVLLRNVRAIQEPEEVTAIRIGSRLHAVLASAAGIMCAPVASQLRMLADECGTSGTTIGAAFNVALRALAAADGNGSTEASSSAGSLYSFNIGSVAPKAPAASSKTPSRGAGAAGGGTSRKTPRRAGRTPLRFGSAFEATPAKTPGGVTSDGMMLSPAGTFSFASPAAPASVAKPAMHCSVPVGPLLQEVSALSQFIRSLLAAEKLTRAEIVAANERNQRRNDCRNASVRGGRGSRSSADDGAGAAASRFPTSMLADHDDMAAPHSPDSSSSNGGSHAAASSSSSSSSGALLCLPPPCSTPQRQVSRCGTSVSKGHSPTPPRTQHKKKAVRFATFDFSAVNSAPDEFAPASLPVPFALPPGPANGDAEAGVGAELNFNAPAAAAATSAAASMQSGAHKDITETGCVALALSDSCAAARALKELMKARGYAIDIELAVEISALKPVTLGECENSCGGSSSPLPPTPIPPADGCVVPLVQVLCAMEACATASAWNSSAEVAMSTPFAPEPSAGASGAGAFAFAPVFSGFPSAASSSSGNADGLKMSTDSSSSACWSDLRGTSRYYAKQLSMLQPAHESLPMREPLSNALSSAMRYHMRRALNPHVYEDDSSESGVSSTRTSDPTSTPPPWKMAHVDTVDGALPGHTHHHHHTGSSGGRGAAGAGSGAGSTLGASTVFGSSSMFNGLMSATYLCGGIGRGGGGIPCGYIAFEAASLVCGKQEMPGVRYNSSDLAALAHKALSCLHRCEEQVAALLVPHSLLKEQEPMQNQPFNGLASRIGGAGATSSSSSAAAGAPAAGFLSLLQLVDAAPVSDVALFAEFAEAHAFLRALFGHESSMSALNRDGECWKRLRMLARIAEANDCEREAHLVPLAKVSKTLQKLLSEAAVVDKLAGFANRTLDRHSKALEMVKKKMEKLHKRNSSTGSAGASAGAASASSSAHATSVSGATASTADDDSANHHRPHKRRGSASRIASPAPADRRRYLELMGSNDEEDAYPEPVPPRALSGLMDEVAGQTSGSSNEPGCVTSSSTGDGGRAASAAAGGSAGPGFDVLNASDNGLASPSDGSMLVSPTAVPASSSASAVAAAAAQAARAAHLLEHDYVLGDRKMRFEYPTIRFFSCSADYREVFNEFNSAALAGGNAAAAPSAEVTRMQALEATSSSSAGSASSPSQGAAASSAAAASASSSTKPAATPNRDETLQALMARMSSLRAGPAASAPGARSGMSAVTGGILHMNLPIPLQIPAATAAVASTAAPAAPIAAPAPAPTPAKVLAAPISCSGAAATTGVSSLTTLGKLRASNGAAGNISAAAIPAGMPVIRAPAPTPVAPPAAANFTPVTPVTGLLGQLGTLSVSQPSATAAPAPGPVPAAAGAQATGAFSGYGFKMPALRPAAGPAPAAALSSSAIGSGGAALSSSSAGLPSFKLPTMTTPASAPAAGRVTKCGTCRQPGTTSAGSAQSMVRCSRCFVPYHAACVGVEATPAGQYKCPSCINK